jgi:predicted ATPase
MRTELPAGTVTFLFTDVEGSTRLLRELGAAAYAEALEAHRRVVRAECAKRGGVEVDTQGDAFFLAFPTASGGVEAAEAIATALTSGPIRLRVGLHTGAPLVTAEGYVGEDVHLAARVAAAGHGGQILLTAATAALVGRPFVELGEHRLKDVVGAVSILQVGNEPFPPLETIGSTNLPRPASSFVGREPELQRVGSIVADGTRLVTFTGPGGAGKTRLAIEAAQALRTTFAAGAFWAGLAALRDPALVTQAIAESIGAQTSLVEHIGARRMLVLLDNFEQVVGAAPELSTLLEACPELTLLVTSRERLRVKGEVEVPVSPLPEPDAVALFCDRAQIEPSPEIAELCARLDALPLAVELAAARAKALSPGQILERLARRLDVLAGGRDADPRQQTLRATIAWSHELLTEDERGLFARLSVFAGGCSLEAAETVARADVDTLQSLVEKSLLRWSDERYSMLETIRNFAADQLDPADSDVTHRRLRAFVVSLARDSAEGLHGAEESVLSTRLAPDLANMRSAVEHALSVGEPDDVGRVLGGLYPFLISHAHLGEALEWTERALGARGRLATGALADTLTGGGEIARFAGDLDRATELKEELLALKDGEPLRPNWRAGTLADLSELALDRDDLAAARMYAEESAAARAGPRADLCFAEIALREGDLLAAESSGLAALGGLADGSFNHACALEILGEAARRAGKDRRASQRFSAALGSFAAIRDGGGVADCLDGLARLAAAADEERAGRLAGAAERLRERHGRRPARADVPPPAGSDAGRELTLDEAVAYAVGGAEPLELRR